MSETRAIHTDPQRRHDILLLVDVRNGNPNGNPDAGNMPRIEPLTGKGWITDVCLKRKVRDHIARQKPKANDALGHDYRIYIQNEGVALNQRHEEAYEAVKPQHKGKLFLGSRSKPPHEVKQHLAEYMCRKYYDVRMFGAMMATDVSCGRITGPVQVTLGESYDRIHPVELAITRQAITRADELPGSGGKKEKETEMGRKSVVPYGLYEFRIFYSPLRGGPVAPSSQDLALFYDALEWMWETDRASGRGMMVCRGLYVFSHHSPLGDAHAHSLFNRLQVKLNEGVEIPRSFGDYRIHLEWDDAAQAEALRSSNEAELPKVCLTRLVEAAAGK